MWARAFDWLFRDRTHGRIVIGQWPNWSLWLFGITQAVAWIAGPASGVGYWAEIAAGVALGIWASDELIRGVNPWRRCLGAAVLIGMLVRLVGTP